MNQYICWHDAYCVCRLLLVVCIACRYPDDAWEILWGYDQDRFMGTRAGAALVQHIKGAVELHHNVVQEQEGWLN